jgi:hypothetical protein
VIKYAPDGKYHYALQSVSKSIKHIVEEPNGQITYAIFSHDIDNRYYGLSSLGKRGRAIVFSAGLGWNYQPGCQAQHFQKNEQSYSARTDHRLGLQSFKKYGCVAGFLQASNN